MKRSIFILIVIVTAICNISAQRLNKQGLKMVSEIEYRDYDKDGTYTVRNVMFIYNNRYELQEYIIRGYNKLNNLIEYVKATKVNNQIILKGKGIPLCKLNNYKIICNEQNLITKIIYNDVYDKHGECKGITEYEYKDVFNDGNLLRYKRNYKFLYRLTKNENFEVQEDSPHIYRYYTNSYNPLYSNKDTNIDLANDYSIEQYYANTEWLPRRNYYFNKYGDYNIVYDNEGNIVEINEYVLKTLQKVIKIKYVEE